jgi:serine/threonine protein kinase
VNAYNIILKEEFLLGEGSNGIVYRITRRSDNFQFAIKISKTSIYEKDKSKVKINVRKEKYCQKLIDHPFIIKLIDEFIIDDK